MFKDYAGMGNVKLIFKTRLQWLRYFGDSLEPINSWLYLQGLETLPLRQRVHPAHALEVAKYLSAHPPVSWVNYPGLENNSSYLLAQIYLKGQFGGIMGFGIIGVLEPVMKFINSYTLFSLLANIGDAKSLVIHPASTARQ